VHEKKQGGILSFKSKNNVEIDGLQILKRGYEGCSRFVRVAKQKER